MYYNTSTEKLVENKHTTYIKRVNMDVATECFNQALYKSGWVEINLGKPVDSY